MQRKIIREKIDLLVEREKNNIEYVVYGRNKDTLKYRKEYHNKAAITEEKTPHWIVSSPTHEGEKRWTEEWQVQFWAAFIELRKPFKLISTPESILTRIFKDYDENTKTHHASPVDGIDYGLGGTAPEIAWLLNNGYVFKKETVCDKNGKEYSAVFARPSDKTPAIANINRAYFKSSSAGEMD